MSNPELTPREWFEKAVRWYVDKHQGCPWCNGANRVYKTERNSVVEYHCGGCDFFACHDKEKDQFFMAPGNVSRAPLTMVAN